MAKLTEIDIKDIVYSRLKDVGLDRVVSGRIYKEARPMNSQSEDVEITVLASDLSQNQRFTVNVNVFVPDVQRDDEFIENQPRIRTLSTAFLEALDYHSSKGFLFTLDSQSVIKVTDAEIHVINNRLEIKYNSEN